MNRRAFIYMGLSASIWCAPAYGQSNSLIIENVTLIDGTGRAPIAGAFVLTDGDRIVRVSREQIDAPAGAIRIDGSGKYVTPGFIDRPT